ncbi:MAG: protein translocase subunit SecD [Spirochaetales bacterium]|nr:protein translocase subunit SecD [Spirochaetales bacterium]
MKATGRIAIIVVVIAICIWFLYPTIVWYGSVSQADRELALGTNSQIRDYARGQASKGLKALKAASSSDPVPEEYSYLKSLVKNVSKSELKKLDIGTLFSKTSEQSIFDRIESEFRTRYMGYKKASQNALQLGLDLKGGLSILLDVDIQSFEAKLGRTASEAEISAAIDQDIEVLKSRIDQFGVTEPEIRRQGMDQILIEVSGEADPERVDTFLRGKGSLKFQIVDNAATKKAVTYFNQHPDELFLEDGSFAQPDFLPKDAVLTGYYVSDEYGIDELVNICVILDNPSIDGSYIANAVQEFEQIQNKPVVNFTLTEEGGLQMYALTKEHVGDVMAVVMDGNVKTQATINTALNTSIQISGFSLDEAKEIAFLLKSATLPIEVSVASQRTIGASLGEDAVRVGTFAIIIGFALVVIFMFGYYGLSGLVADLGLVLNMFMIISILGGFKSTFTLTGIAGLILTLGMAVDANVIIFERIKEQLAIGAVPRNAVFVGYKEAFWTIMDSNITTMIAAVVLIILGSSSVRGFATTLAIGLCSSVFCSLFVCHLIMDMTNDKQIHIGWGRKVNGR